MEGFVPFVSAEVVPGGGDVPDVGGFPVSMLGEVVLSRNRCSTEESVILLPAAGMAAIFLHRTKD